MLPLVLSSDSHVFEPPDLWQTRIDRGVPRSCAADRADRRRRPDRGRGGSDPLRDRPHLERRRAVRGPRDDLRPGALRRRAPRRVRPRAAPRGHGARRGGRRSPLSLARAVLLQGGGHAADVRDLSRLQRLARRVLPHRSRPAQGHRDDQPGRRRGRDQGAGARRPPGPRRRDDHRVSGRGPALRPTRVRAVLGRRRGARHAAEPAHGDAAAGQDPRGRSRDAARRQQPRDEGVLSGAVDVRHDLLRRLRAPSRA